MSQSNALRAMVNEACHLKQPMVRLSKLLENLGIACLSGYAKPGRKPKGVPQELAAARGKPSLVGLREDRAVVARRAGLKVTNQQL